MRLHDFLQRESPAAAALALTRIEGAATALSQFPRMGRALPPPRHPIREWFADFGRGSFVLRYRLLPTGQPLILRVFHSREQRS